jgi:hypothetical protein
MQEDIHNELKEIAPTIAAMPRAEAINAPPDGYFQELEAQLLTLSKIVRVEVAEEKQSVGMPANYFEYIEDKVLQQLTTPEVEVRQISWLRRYKWAVAASFLLVVSAVAVQNITSSKETPTLASDDLTSEEALTYLEQNQQDGQIEALIDAGVIDSTLVADLTFFEDVELEDGSEILQSTLDF